MGVLSSCSNADFVVESKLETNLEYFCFSSAMITMEEIRSMRQFDTKTLSSILRIHSANQETK